MERRRIAVIADNGMVPRFGLSVLDAVRGCEEITVFSCTGPRARRGRGLHHAAPGLPAARNTWTRPVPVDQGRKRVEETVEFAAGFDGARQTLPAEVVKRLREGGFGVVLKLGMGPLEVPPPEVLPLPILAFHHGDPERYRSGPVAFWEMVHGEPAMEQVVEVLGDDPEATRVVASAETKVFPHSHRATIAEAYRHSPLLIDRAIENALSGTEAPARRHAAAGPAPSTSAVARFVLSVARQRLRRVVYGAVVEKRWHVSTATAPADVEQALSGQDLIPEPRTWHTLRPSRGYVFYADPFFSADPPGVLVEALRASTGRGEIVLVQGERHDRVSPPGGHFSYPAPLHLAGRQHIVPETASWNPPTCYVVENGAFRSLGPLDVDPGARILDPTLVEHRGRVYLFGNLRDVGSGPLHLWVADGLTAPFRRHPASPVLISPRGARMAGGLLRSGDTLIRFGQDFCSGYGDGIFAFRIDELSPTAYREHPIGEVRFADRKGPHTLNVGNGQVVFDWYQDAFAPLAGVRRVLALTGRD